MKNILILTLLILSLVSASCTGSKVVDISYNSHSSIISYGVARLSDHIKTSGYTVNKHGKTSLSQKGIFVIAPGDHPGDPHQAVLSDHIEGITSEGYKIVKLGDIIYVIGKTEEGCLYGIMDLIEQLGVTSDFAKLEESQVNPAYSLRAIKFNLPWAPYRPGPANDLHQETCRDLDYWEAFLDMMVANRFNALTLWSTHLFPYMIRAENYPDATPFNESELQQWKTFWKALFRMAKERGIETYLVNWNIVVSPEFASAYDAQVHGDLSDVVKKYTRESVTQLINEYEDLTGLGVTLADWMGNWGENLMTPVEREEWIEDTFAEGMKRADRKIKFIHRAVLAGDPGEMRKVIDHAELPERTIVEVKFNWSHGHSTPHLSLTHSNQQGTIMRGFWDPKPENYFIAWTIRNEDFFVLRWGDPNFIREHLKVNNHPYVDGYFVGSEGYIPAKDYAHKEHPHKTWDYAFQKQWLFYYLWGRLTYNPDVSDEILARAFEVRYPDMSGIHLLNAYSLASKVPLEIASFYKSTWDFTLYSEGFLAPWTTGYDDKKSPFISLEELIRHETLDDRYMNIIDFSRMEHDGTPIDDGLITPLELAAQLENNCSRAMKLISDSRASAKDITLESELDDLETWCHLGFYFSEKLRAGVALESYRNSGKGELKENTVDHLQNCVSHWEDVIRLTSDRYQPMPYVSMGHHDQKWPDFKAFHWELFRNEVQADLDYVKNLKD
jgi:hypothetical protein